MNTSAFQCSVFISVMMVVAVYSPSVHSHPSNKDECVILLRRIKNATGHLLKLDLHRMVPKIYKDTCTNHFFCLAEKVVYNITEAMNISQHDKFKDLRRALHQYNNKKNETYCPLDVNSRYQLHDFLKNVSKCTDRALQNTNCIR